MAQGPVERTAVRALSQQLGGPLVEVHQVSERKIPGEGGEFAVRLYWPRASANDADSARPSRTIGTPRQPR
jgi:hypothetical protein